MREISSVPLRMMVVGLLAAAACRSTAAPGQATAGDPARQAAAPPAAEDLGARVRAIQLHMHLRFAAARRVEQAIVFGDLARARGEAKIIAELDEPGILPAWQPYIDDVREAARRVSVASNLIVAANTSAILGHQCAQCHVSAHAKIALPAAPTAPLGAPIAPDMATHQSATTRMWEGLILPSTERWQLGATTLAQAPFDPVVEPDLPPELSVFDDVARIRLLAGRALAASSPDDRAKLYGELLATCAGCHATIRDR